jgi:predicted component of type VI protein secretion system
VRRTGLMARLAVTGLRRLLEQEARARRRLGSRQTMAQPLRDANPLRMARTPDDAVQRLLVSDDEATDAMREACLELLGHHERLQVAFAGAARRLGQDLEPASLDAALGPAGGAPGSVQRKAELWDLYVHLWQALGMTSDGLWTRGFIDAAMVHLTSAYDEDVQDQDGAR